MCCNFFNLVLVEKRNDRLLGKRICKVAVRARNYTWTAVIFEIIFGTYPRFTLQELSVNLSRGGLFTPNIALAEQLFSNRFFKKSQYHQLVNPYGSRSRLFLIVHIFFITLNLNSFHSENNWKWKRWQYGINICGNNFSSAFKFLWKTFFWKPLAQTEHLLL